MLPFVTGLVMLFVLSLKNCRHLKHRIGSYESVIIQAMASSTFVFFGKCLRLRPNGTGVPIKKGATIHHITMTLISLQIGTKVGKRIGDSMAALVVLLNVRLTINISFAPV